MVSKHLITALAKTIYQHKHLTIDLANNPFNNPTTYIIISALKKLRNQFHLRLVLKLPYKYKNFRVNYGYSSYDLLMKEAANKGVIIEFQDEKPENFIWRDRKFLFLLCYKPQLSTLNRQIVQEEQQVNPIEIQEEEPFIDREIRQENKRNEITTESCMACSII